MRACATATLFLWATPFQVGSLRQARRAESPISTVRNRELAARNFVSHYDKQGAASASTTYCEALGGIDHGKLFESSAAGHPQVNSRAVVHHRRDRHPGGWYRGQYACFQRARKRFAQAAALSPVRPLGRVVAQCPRPQYSAPRDVRRQLLCISRTKPNVSGHWPIPARLG